MFNNILDRKETFFGDKIFHSFKVPKITSFAKGLTHGFVQKRHFFLYLFLVKIRLEITLNNVLDRKETGECKKRNEFAEWHVAWLKECHNYVKCNICRITQRNKLN